MRRVTLSIPVPGWLPSAVRSRRRQALNADKTLDLTGDRDIEWSWIAARMPEGPGEALDFGPGGSSLALQAASRGFTVTAVDLGTITWPYRHARLSFLQGDILDLPLEDRRFDLVLNCSTIEHVGIVGRYGVRTARPDGDLEAMTRLRAVMKPGGVMLLTIPVGQDAVFPPLHRVYGERRLARLLDGFTVTEREFWLKGQDNRWSICPEPQALELEPQERLYGLGCFVLSKG